MGDLQQVERWQYSEGALRDSFGDYRVQLSVGQFDKAVGRRPERA